jgi:hypothetical protein
VNETCFCSQLSYSYTSNNKVIINALDLPCSYFDEKKYRLKLFSIVDLKQYFCVCVCVLMLSS